MEYAFFVLLVGYLTTLGPAIVGIGGWSLGASGITNGLWGTFTTLQFAEFVQKAEQESAAVSELVIHLGGFLLGTLFVLRSIAEYVGLLSPVQGAATAAHLVGVGAGLAWGVHKVVTGRE